MLILKTRWEANTYDQISAEIDENICFIADWKLETQVFHIHM